MWTLKIISPSFSFVLDFRAMNLKNDVDVSKIRTRIVRVKVTYADQQHHTVTYLLWIFANMAIFKVLGYFIEGLFSIGQIV